MEIELPDYKKIASGVKRKKISVEEKEIDTVLKWLELSRAKFTFKNQPAQIGDFVEIEYYSPQIEVLGEKEIRKDGFILGEGHFIPGFEEKLIGMRAGEEKEEISIILPENHFLKNLAGKKVSFKVKMKSVQNVEFPKADDQFAKSLGNFENLTALKKNIKEGIYLEKERAESFRLRNEILEKINLATACDVPEVLVQKEKKQMLENFKKNVLENLKISFEDYLNKIKKTEKEVLDSFLAQAQKKVKSFLVLKEIGEKEKIEKEVDSEKLKEYTKEALRNEKIFQFLENLVPRL